MSKQHKSILVVAMVMLFVGTSLFIPLLGAESSWVLAADNCPGDLDCDGDVDGSDLATFAADFGRTDCSTACQSRMVGEIIMWSGQMDLTGKHPVIHGEPDTRWHICAGEQGTPNLLGRFIKAAQADETPVVGGSGSVAILEENLPAHGHGVVGKTNCVNHDHKLFHPQKTVNYLLLGGSTPVLTEDLYAQPVWRTSPKGTVTPSGNKCYNPEEGHTHSINLSTTTVGSGEPVDIIPPYYALVFLMYIGD